MNNGWIKTYRQFLDWEWYSTPNMVHVFTTLLLLANHEEKKWKGQTVGRGQLITGRKSLAKRTGLSEQQIRTCLKYLKSTNELTIKPTNKYSLITISNYSKYQIVEKSQPASQPASQPTTNQQLTTNKNIRTKENKKYRAFAQPTLLEVKDYCKERNNHVDAQRFIDFYESKGWMVGKNKMKSWQAAVRTWEKSSGTTNNEQTHITPSRKDLERMFN